MSKFQLILTAAFGFFILIGVGVFAFYRANSNVQSNVVVWGSMPHETFYNVLSSLPISKDKTVAVSYIHKAEQDFDKAFIEALASGAGPDVIMLDQDSILSLRNKLFLIPYDSYPLRSFKDIFIEEGELFLDPVGIVGIPITVDPLMMYWNRDIFSSEGVAQPPRYWSEFFELSKAFTKKDGALNIARATVPLGEYSNIVNAKEIISTLMMQAGTQIVARGQNGFTPVISTNQNQSAVLPTASALNFYTDFANPSKTHYSWNRSLPNSQLMFLSGDLAVYFGFASELPTLRIKNPNLNFDVAMLPQSSASSVKTTFGTMKALAITKNTRSPAAAFSVINGLTNPAALAAFAQYTGLPPVSRNLLSKGSANPNQALFFQSALFSKAWYDPNKYSSSAVFRNMIESITGGRARTSESIQQAQQEFLQLLNTTY